MYDTLHSNKIYMYINQIYIIVYIMVWRHSSLSDTERSRLCRPRPTRCEQTPITLLLLVVLLIDILNVCLYSIMCIYMIFKLIPLSYTYRQTWYKYLIHISFVKHLSSIFIFMIYIYKSLSVIRLKNCCYLFIKLINLVESKICHS